MSNYVTLSQGPVCQFSWCPQRDMSLLWPVIKLQGESTSDRQTVTSDGDGRSPAWPVITLLLRTFVIGLGIFEIPEKPSHSRQKIAVLVRFRLKTGGFRFENRHSTNFNTCTHRSEILLHVITSVKPSLIQIKIQR